MSINDVWFALFAIIIAGYLILDGFDMGVGILLVPFAKDDTERRTFLNSIGPVWDGNEVWLVLGGGVLFAVFPLAYASLFSGLYLAFMLVLVAIILRTVALEFRSKEPGTRWRTTWDAVFGGASLGLALLLGIAFGNILWGLPLDANGDISIGLIGLLLGNQLVQRPAEMGQGRIGDNGEEFEVRVLIHRPLLGFDDVFVLHETFDQAGVE